MTESHPTLEQLADRDAGLLDADQATRITRHLLLCQECAVREQQLNRVKAAITDLGLEQMPEPVSARLERALQEADPPPGKVDPARGLARPARSRLGLASLAAAAVVILLAAGLVLGATHFGQGSRQRHSAAAAAAGAAAGGGLPAAFPVTSSGREYTKANLAGLVPAIVAAHALASQPGREGLGAPPAGVSEGTAGQTYASAAGPTQSLLNTLRTSRRALLACDEVVSAGSGTLLVPLAVDLGSWAGQPAAVFVLPVPGQPASADVFVEGAGCAAGHDATLYYLRVARPAGS